MPRSSRRNSETPYMRAILDLLAAERVFAGRVNTMALPTASGNYVKAHSFGEGTADILAFPVCRRWPTKTDCTLHRITGAPTALPTILWIEVKAPGGKQSLAQVRFQNHVEKQGHHYLVAVDSGEVLNWLKEHDHTASV